jgi:hypothetical protein
MTARLPVPGADDGIWGTVLNDYLSQSLATDGTIKPGVVGASQVSDGALPEAKIQNLTSDLAAKVDTTLVGVANGIASLNADAKVPTSQLSITGDPYPISAYGFFTASANLTDFNGSSTIGALFFARIFVPAGKTINAVATIVTAPSTFTGSSGNCFCIYDDSGTLVATTPVDDTLWAATGWRIGEFSTPIAAQPSDRFVYASPFIIGYSGNPSIVYSTVGNQELFYGGYNKPNHRRAFYINSAPSVPNSFDPTSYGNNSSYLPLIALG